MSTSKNINFGTFITRVSKQAHPGTPVSKESKDLVSDYVSDISNAILEEADTLRIDQGKKTLMIDHIKASTRDYLDGSNDFCENAIIEGKNASNKFNKSLEATKAQKDKGEKVARTTQQGRAGLQFPIAKFKTIAKGICDCRIKDDAIVFLTAVIEYIVLELMRSAGDVAEENKKKTITPAFIQKAVEQDEELAIAIQGSQKEAEGEEESKKEEPEVKKTKKDAGVTKKASKETGGGTGGKKKTKKDESEEEEGEEEEEKETPKAKKAPPKTIKVVKVTQKKKTPPKEEEEPKEDEEEESEKEEEKKEELKEPEEVKTSTPPPEPKEKKEEPKASTPPPKEPKETKKDVKKIVQKEMTTKAVEDEEEGDVNDEDLSETELKEKKAKKIVKKPTKATGKNNKK